MTPTLIAGIYHRRGFEAAHTAAVMSQQLPLVLEVHILSFQTTGIAKPIRKMAIGSVDLSTLKVSKVPQVGQGGRTVLCLRKPVQQRAEFAESATPELLADVKAKIKERAEKEASYAAAKARREDLRDRATKAISPRRGNLTAAEIAARRAALQGSVTA